MIAPDDPRHGTSAGYCAGCREHCCRRAQADQRQRHRQLNYLLGGNLLIDPTGTRRRIRALVAIGYPTRLISEKLGHSKFWTNSVVKQKQVHRRTAGEIAKLYNELSMTPGPSEESRRRAALNGWPTPLCWDDDTIDNPNAQPYKAPSVIKDGIVDEVLVQRALAGQPVKATKGERAEIVRRWLKLGRSLKELERIQGFNPFRYKEVA